MRTTLSMIMAFAIIGIINAQDGNVGIGIDTPSARLHVQDGNIKVVNPDRPWLIFDHPSAGLNGGLQWWLDGDVEMELFYDGIAKDLRFWDTQAGVPRVTIKRTGNMGIGTAAPSSALEINGQLEIGAFPYSTIKSRADNLQFRIWSSYTPFKGAYILANGADFPNDGGSLYFTHGDYTAPGPTSLIYFRYASDSVITTQAVMTADGEFGIGTVTPVARLHVDDGPVLFTGVFNDPSPVPPPVEGAGNRLMWYPDKAAFRTGLVDGAQWDQDSIGDNSFATGENTVASGWRSVAMGWKSRATGTASFAVGGTATASNGYAAAFGSQTLASGGQSFAVGFGSKAESWASAAFGRYNVGGGAPTIWNATDPIFEIGIGSADDNRANALTVLKSGNTGIGTVTPAFPLHVETDNKLRAGYFYNEYTSASSTFGLWAGAFGNGPGTKYGGAFDAVGTGNENRGVSATASEGTKNVAIYAHAAGGTTNWAAHFDNGYVIVDDRIGVGTTSPLFPVDVTTSSLNRAGYFYNNKSTTLTTYGIYGGVFSNSSGDKRGGQFSVSGGTGENTGVRATADNGTTNIAVYGSASGGTTNWAAHFDAGYVIVDERVGIGTINPSTELHVNGILQIGSFERLDDGGSLVIRSNSDIIPSSDNARDLGSSSARWNEVYSANGVVTTSDRNQKTDIKLLGYGLQEVMQLEPVTYKWATGADQRERIGLIAQDVLNVIPEVVVTHNKAEDEEGNITEELLDILGMHYSDLIPVLIKGMQEQQAVIQQLTEENATLQVNQIKIIEALEAAGIQIEN